MVGGLNKSLKILEIDSKILKYYTIIFGYTPYSFLLNNVYVLLENTVQKECTLILLRHQEISLNNHWGKDCIKQLKCFVYPFLLKEQHKRPEAFLNSMGGQGPSHNLFPETLYLVSQLNHTHISWSQCSRCFTVPMMSNGTEFPIDQQPN